MFYIVLKVCFNKGMRKSQATSLFGDVASMAKAIGITVQAIYIWPDELTDAISDRVVAAFARKCERENRHADFWAYLNGTFHAPTPTEKA